MKRTVIVATLAAAMLLSAVAFASADSATYGSGTPGNVTVKAAVNPKITLTVTTPEAGQTVDFGTVDPGVTAAKLVNLSVDSNKQFDLVASQDTSVFGGITLNRSLLGGASDVAKGGSIPFVDSYTLDVPWTTDPNAYTASVTYTVTQD